MIQFRALAGPVLKHGPRSLACVLVIETIHKTERRNESEGVRLSRAQGGWSVGLDRSLALPRRLVSNP